MTIQNYIFQIRNTIFQVLKNSEIGAQVVLNKANDVVHPYILIEATRKRVLENNQKELITDLQIATKDFSVISVSNILTKIENIITQNALQANIDYYSLHFSDIINSSVFPNEDGFFYGKVSILSIIDDS